MNLSHAMFHLVFYKRSSVDVYEFKTLIEKTVVILAVESTVNQDHITAQRMHSSIKIQQNP